MIRRNPTVIPMTDLDVQDVRDMVAQQKAAAAKSQLIVSKLKRMTDNPAMTDEEKQVLSNFKGGFTSYQEHRRRLGLEPELEPSQQSQS